MAHHHPTITVEEIVEALGLEGEHVELTKSDLHRLLYEKMRMKVNEPILFNIFSECDTAQSGRISMEELTDYLNHIEHPSNAKLSHLVFSKTVRSKPFIAIVLFMTGIIIHLIASVINLVAGNLEIRTSTRIITTIFFFLGSFIYSLREYYAVKSEIKLIERASAKVMLWAESEFHLSSLGDESEHELGPSDRLTLRGLKKVLEESCIFLPQQTLVKLFNKVDADMNGTLSFVELSDYAAAHANDHSNNRQERAGQVRSECYRNSNFRFSLGWSIGFFFLMIASFGAVRALDVMGDIIIMISSLAMFLPYFKKVNASLDYALEVRKFLRSSALASRQHPSGDNNGDHTAMETDQDTATDKNASIRAGATALFTTIDGTSEDSQQREFDFIELYDFFTQAGFVTELDILHSVFRQADVSRDGSLQLTEFVDYIEGIDTDADLWPFTRPRDILKVAIGEFYFYVLLIQLCGAICLIVSAASSLDELYIFVMDLVAFTVWVLPMLYFASMLFDSNAQALRSVTYSKNIFRAHVLNAIHDEDRSVLPKSFTDHEEKFAETVFSFICVVDWFSVPFITTLVTLLFQCAVLFLIIWGLLTGDPGNPVGIPAAVEAPVLVAQVVALMLAAVTQVDLVTALAQVVEGYHQENVEIAFHDASYDKWLLSNIVMSVGGVMTLVTVFLLVITSADVVDLLLNFTALEFISILDDIIFFLSRRGFLGLANEAVSRKIEDTSFQTPISKGKRTGLKVFLLLLFSAGMMVAWATVYARQLEGYFLPQTLIAQFDDEANIVLGTYSGLYALEIRKLNFGYRRIRYVGENDVGMFAYCNSEGAWTFSKSQDDDPCERYLAISSESAEFDITITNTEEWFSTPDPDAQPNRYYPMDSFHIGPLCEDDVDCGSAGRGICDSNRCICSSPFYGWRCDFDEESTCEVFESDSLIGSGFPAVYRNFSERFYMLRKPNGELFTSNYRPLYSSQIDGGAGVDLLMYTGLRWSLFPLSQMLNITSEDSLLAYVNADFINNRTSDLILSSLEFFFSDPIWFNTPGETVTPIDVTWNQARRFENSVSTFGTDAVLLCAKCNNVTNPCANDGFCPETGFCECNHGATGILCRVAPISNAVCNSEYFNTDDFRRDGGDCCESTCVNTNEQTCGFSSFIESEIVQVKFPNCSDPATLCTPAQGSSQCWRNISQPLPVDATSLNLILSTNGNLLVRATSTGLKVRDKADSRWVQRGSDITGVRGSRFGERIAISTPFSAIQGGLTGIGVNDIIAVSLYRISKAGATVFNWNSDTGSWNQLGSEISFCDTACSLGRIDIGSEKGLVSLAANVNDEIVLVYTLLDLDLFSSDWRLAQSIPGNISCVSGNGQVLAVISRVRVTIYAITGSGSLEILNEGDFEELGTGFKNIQAMGLSFDGKELSLVGLNETTGDFVVTLNTTMPIPPTRLNLERVGPLSRKALRAGFNPSSISIDGSSVGVLVDTFEGPKIRIYRLEQSSGWIQVDALFWNGDVSIDRRFAISSHASTLAVEGSTAVVTATPFPLCPVDRKRYRLSIPLEAASGNISWTLRSFTGFGNETLFTNSVDEVCDDCYKGLETSLISVEGCIPKAECLELKYRYEEAANHSQPFYFFEDDFLLQKGVIDDISEQSQVLGSGCKTTIQDTNCTQGQSLFLLALNMDREVSDTSWYLEDENKTVLLSGGGYLPSGGSVYFRSACVPSTGQCLSFIMQDSFGDGTCCAMGAGKYSLFLDGQQVISRNGDAFGYGERVEFGDCQTRVIPPENVSITIFSDPNPEEISWYMEDGLGDRFAESTSFGYGDVVNVTLDVPVPISATDDLYFTVEDSGGDGFSGYSLNYNGDAILSLGTAGYGERVQLDKSGTVHPVTPLVLMSLSMQLDNRPNETSFSLIDVGNGRMVGGAATGAYASLSANATVIEQFFLLSGVPYELTLFDAGGNGFSDGAGSYNISLNGQVLFTGNGTFASDITFFLAWDV